MVDYSMLNFVKTFDQIAGPAYNLDRDQLAVNPNMSVFALCA